MTSQTLKINTYEWRATWMEEGILFPGQGEVASFIQQPGWLLQLFDRGGYVYGKMDYSITTEEEALQALFGLASQYFPIYHFNLELPL